MKKGRPLGVTVLGWFLAFTSAACWFVVIVLGALWPLGLKNGYMTQSDWAKALSVGTVLGLFNLVLSVGLLRLHNWARLVILGCALISLCTAIVGLMTSGMKNFSIDIPIQLAIDAVLVGYLLRPSVKAQFVSKGR